MKVEVIQAWPRNVQSRFVELAEGARVADAVAASGFDVSDIVAHAIFGVRVDAGHRLCDGDRIELLRPLQADPKETRRKRAAHRMPPRAG